MGCFNKKVDLFEEWFTDWFIIHKIHSHLSPPTADVTCRNNESKSQPLHFWSREQCMICTGNVTWGNVIGGGLSYITQRLLLLPFASGVSLRASAPHRADGNTNTSKSLFISQISLHYIFARLYCVFSTCDSRTSTWMICRGKMWSGSTPCQFLHTVSPFALV